MLLRSSQWLRWPARFGQRRTVMIDVVQHAIHGRRPADKAQADHSSRAPIVRCAPRTEGATPERGAPPIAASIECRCNHSQSDGAPVI